MCPFPCIAARSSARLCGGEGQWMWRLQPAAEWPREPFAGCVSPPAPLSRPPPSRQPVHQRGKPSSGAFPCKKTQQPRAAAGLLVSPSRCWCSLGIKLSRLGWGCGSMRGGSAGGRAACCAAGRCGRCSWHFRQFSPSSPRSAVPSLPTHAHGKEQAGGKVGMVAAPRPPVAEGHSLEGHLQDTEVSPSPLV